MANHDVTTSLDAVLRRIVDSSVDEIAKDGINILKSIVDSSGFADSEYLKDYEIFSHVSGHEITFEIIVSLESLDEESKEEVLSKEESSDKLEDSSTRTFGINSNGVIGRIYSLKERVHDARTPTRNARRSTLDARKPVRDARRSSIDTKKDSIGRSVEHMLKANSPRSVRVDRAGKLSIQMKNQIRINKTSSEVVYPNKKYSGIIGDFIDRLKIAISEKFSPKISEILAHRLKNDSI